MANKSVENFVRQTRIGLVKRDGVDIPKSFKKVFGVSAGDYVRFGSVEYDLRTARVISCDQMFYNEAGGYTGTCTIAPLLKSGKLGKTRNLTLIRTKSSALIGIGKNKIIKLATKDFSS